jgi:hypothetical protein
MEVYLVDLFFFEFSDEALMIPDLLLRLQVAFRQLAREPKLGLRIRQPLQQHIHRAVQLLRLSTK